MDERFISSWYDEIEKSTSMPSSTSIDCQKCKGLEQRLDELSNARIREKVEADIISTISTEKNAKLISIISRLIYRKKKKNVEKVQDTPTGVMIPENSHSVLKPTRARPKTDIDEPKVSNSDGSNKGSGEMKLPSTPPIKQTATAEGDADNKLNAKEKLTITNQLICNPKNFKRKFAENCKLHA